MMTSQKNWYSIRTRKCLRYLVPSWKSMIPIKDILSKISMPKPTLSKPSLKLMLSKWLYLSVLLLTYYSWNCFFVKWPVSLVRKVIIPICGILNYVQRGPTYKPQSSRIHLEFQGTNVPTSKTSFRRQVRLLLSEAKPSYVYSILKPHGQSFRNPNCCSQQHSITSPCGFRIE